MSNTMQMFLTEALVYAALKEVIDPELGLNIVDLGLVYEVAIADGAVTVVMTLTTPGCPMHASFGSEIEATLWRALPGLESLDIQLVWEPPWTPEMLTAEGRAELGFY